MALCSDAVGHNNMYNHCACVRPFDAVVHRDSPIHFVTHARVLSRKHCVLLVTNMLSVRRTCPRRWPENGTLHNTKTLFRVDAGVAFGRRAFMRRLPCLSIATGLHRSGSFLVERKKTVCRRGPNTIDFWSLFVRASYSVYHYDVHVPGIDG